ncbi:MAG: GNAT family N-acetyltransferase [Bacteroidia bacterium]
MISIVALTPERLGAFFQYLTMHVAENGLEGATLFLPLSRQQSAHAGAWKSKFEDGMHKAYGETGWRKAWVAVSQDNSIVGHIDIRLHPQLNASHRVLLGIGVDSRFRGLGIGQTLLSCVVEYCRSDSRISWIDLEVMANNAPARSLYEKMGFEELSTTRDMFRIDGVSYDYTSMTLYVGS